MEGLNVHIADGIRTESERIGTRTTTTVTQPCGCETTTMHDSRPMLGGSSYSAKTCDKHRIQSWNWSLAGPPLMPVVKNASNQSAGSW